MASKVVGHPVIDMVTERKSVYERLVRREDAKSSILLPNGRYIMALVFVFANAILSR